MKRLFKRWTARWALAFKSDTEFIEMAFREILGRNADLDGLNHYRRVLREGVSRTAVLFEIMRSDEFVATLQQPAPSLPKLRSSKPDQYGTAVDRSNGHMVSTFEVRQSADFDWLEAQILDNGYYEKP